MASVIEREGVVRDEKTGELIIPASQRPDGTWRKARRVRDGYIPQEEVPLFESKGTQFIKSLPTHPIGLSPKDIAKNEQVRKAATEVAPPAVIHTSKAAKKNAKRKEKKRQEQMCTAGGEKTGGDVAKMTSSVDQISISSAAKKDAIVKVATGHSESKADLEKKLKNLKKKLKQIEDLETKIASGELKTPEKEQLNKIAKKQAVIDEIEDIEEQIEDS